MLKSHDLKLTRRTAFGCCVASIFVALLATVAGKSHAKDIAAGNRKSVASSQAATNVKGSAGKAEETKPPASQKEVAAVPDFQREILPILSAKCVRCHGAGKREGELDLRTVSLIVKGGDSGKAVVPGDLKKSLLLERIVSGDMPPPGEGKPVTPSERTLIERWIAGGAPAPKEEAKVSLVSEKDRQFWSFVKPVKRTPPVVRNVDRVRTPVDAFVLQKLEAKGLALNEEADRRTLLRRLWFDVVGLPPSPEEIAEFVADRRPDAYERRVEELLNSPHYGERWARHWLDVVGYADSNGRRGDEIRPWAFRYRDYVIRSLNADKPYDQFLIEQIAGDELLDWRNAKVWSPQMVENLVATGFLRTARDATDTEQVDMRDDRFEALHDTVEVTLTALLGLSVGCAKCHSHKYDPIPQSDFYRVEACFTPAYNPNRWIPANHRGRVGIDQLRYLPEGPPAVIAQEKQLNQQIDREIAELKKSLAPVLVKYRAQIRAERIAKLPAAEQAVLKKTASSRTAAEKTLAAMLEKKLRITDKIIAADPSYQRETQSIQAKIKAAESRRPAPRDYIWALWDLDPKPPETHLLKRGNLLTPGEVVTPGVVTVLDSVEKPAEFVSAPLAEKGTTGRRLQLAQWIASRDNPLTARVEANRIWQHHFGKGIVSTPHDFGQGGARPTHPELLDWLACELMDSGWSRKHLHRQILLSATYRQSGEFHIAKGTIDPDNELIWRKEPLRLEGEIVRDSILAVCNQLNTAMYGPGLDVRKAADGQFVPAAAGFAAGKRSIYLLSKRSENVTLLTTFDVPQMELICTERYRSTVPQQALSMMNSPFLVEQATALAGEIDRAGPKAPEGAIRELFRRVLSRAPSSDELKLMTQFFETTLKDKANGGRSAALFQLAHTLLNTNEFLYVD